MTDYAAWGEEQLQDELKKLAKATKAMGPMLFYLRQKMNKQGVKGEGWSHWVEKHLPITVRTANTWATEWARAEGKMPKTTSGKISRSKRAEVYKFTVPRSEVAWFTKAKEKEFHSAIEQLGDFKAFEIFFHAVTKAANGKAFSARA